MVIIGASVDGRLDVGMSTGERVFDGIADAPAFARPAPLIPTKLGVPLLATAYRERPASTPISTGRSPTRRA